MPGHQLIRALAAVGLARNIKGPASEPAREGLQRTHGDSQAVEQALEVEQPA